MAKQDTSGAENPIGIFSELFVISDLHLGGAEDKYRLFWQDDRLAELLKYVKNQAATKPTSRVALVVAGDIVDFLIPHEKDRPGEQRYLRLKDDAEAVIQAVAKQNPRTVRAFGELIEQDNVTVMMMLGNHDLELRMQQVWEAWAKVIVGEGGEAQKLGRLLDDEEGVLLQVGQARVRIVHGNAVDAWNEVDVKRLREVAQDANQKLKQNAGTELVVDILNWLAQHPEHHYGFLSVMKPEGATLKTLLVHMPLSYQAMRRVLKIAPRAATAASINQKRRFAVLGPPEDSTAEALRTESQEPRSPDWWMSGSDYLQQAKDDASAGLTPEQLSQGHDGELGLFRYGFDRLTRSRNPQEALRHALQDWVDSTETYSPAGVSDDDQRLMKREASEPRPADILIAGHTHLCRAVERKGGGYYINTGTWIPLLKLSQDQLSTQEKFAPVFDDLLEKKLDISELRTRGYLWDRSTVARVWEDDQNTTRVDLYLVEGVSEKTFELISLLGRDQKFAVK